MFDLKTARLKARVSQEKLSFLSGVGRFNIGQHERGVRELSPQELKSIKSALDKERKNVANKKG